MDTSPSELEKAVKDPLRSQCPKFAEDSGVVTVLTQNSQDHILACAVFLLESKSVVRAEEEDQDEGSSLKVQMVKYLVEVAKNLDKVEFSPRRFSTNS